MNIFDHTTIGMELEFFNMTRPTAARIISDTIGGDGVHHVGGTYDEYNAVGPDGRVWKVVTDSSIPADWEHQCEFVTPICNYEQDIETIQNIVRALRAGGAKTDPSKCGIHVHIGAKVHNATTIRHLVNIVASREPHLRAALECDPDRIRWHRPANDNEFVTDLNATRPQEMTQLFELWYSKNAPGENTYAHYNKSRYHGVNLHATHTKGTVEFRYFNSTLHAGKVKTYIQLCLAISYKALTMTRSTLKNCETTNQKYFIRCWLIELGMKGPEFETARHVLVDHLQGNSARAAA